MKFQKSVLFAVIFIVLAGILAAIQYYGLRVAYAAKEEAQIVVFAEIILVGVIVFYVRRYASWREIGFGKISWLRVLWIAPVLILTLSKGAMFIEAVMDSKPSPAVIIGCEPTAHRLHSAASACDTKRLLLPPALQAHLCRFSADSGLFLGLITLFCKRCTVGGS